MRRSLVAMLVIAPASLAAQTRSAPPSIVSTAAKGTLTAREPYRFRFPTRAAWLASWRDRPNGRATATAFAALFPEADYAGWAGERTTRTSTITYRNGLAVRGLMVEPRTPGRHPVIIYNHGGMGRYGALAEFDRFVYPDAIPGYRTDPEAALARRSPIGWPERLSPRMAILLLHGGDDARVPTTGTLEMAQALQRLHRPYRLKVFEGAGHDLFDDVADARVELDRWVDRYVRDGVTPPSNSVATLPPEVTDAP